MLKDSEAPGKLVDEPIQNFNQRNISNDGIKLIRFNGTRNLAFLQAKCLNCY